MQATRELIRISISLELWSTQIKTLTQDTHTKVKKPDWSTPTCVHTMVYFPQRFVYCPKTGQLGELTGHSGAFWPFERETLLHFPFVVLSAPRVLLGIGAILCMHTTVNRLQLSPAMTTMTEMCLTLCYGHAILAVSRRFWPFSRLLRPTLIPPPKERYSSDFLRLLGPPWMFVLQSLWSPSCVRSCIPRSFSPVSSPALY